MRAQIVGLVGVLALLVSLGTSPASRAEGCRELGGLEVAIGAMIGAGVILFASFVGPAAAVAQDDRLSYWDGFGWSLLGGALGVGAGSLIAATIACDQGMWLPGTLGLGGSIVSLVLWSQSAGPDDVAETNIELDHVSVGVAPLTGGLTLSLGGRF